MKPAAAFAAALLACLGSLSIVPGADAEDPTPEVSVAWPEVTRFNPTLTSYEAVVTNNGTGHLFSSFGPADEQVPDVTRVPSDGRVGLAPDRAGVGVVRIWTCPTDVFTTYGGRCTVAATSPTLTLYSKLSVSAGPDYHGPVTMKAGVNRFTISYSPGAPDIVTPTATWELRGSGGEPLRTPITGTVAAADLTRDANGYTDLPIDIPASVPTGRYNIDVLLSVDDPDFGHLEDHLGDGMYSIFAYIDTTLPRLTVGKHPTTFYPVSDGYLDRIDLPARSSEPSTATLEVFDAAGARVRRYGGLWLYAYGGSTPSWDGRNDRSQIVGEGTYTLKLTVTDDGGNIARWSGKVVVSHKRLQWLTGTYTVKAAPYLLGKLVGKCSALARKPHQALGFYSQTKCASTSGNESVVVANFGMYLPRAVQNQYSWGRVDLNGGPATKSSKNYIVSALVHTGSGKLVGRREFHRGNRSHKGQRVGLGRGVVFDADAARPYLVWTAGLTGGSRYNVRGFTVTVRYQVLR